MAYSSSFRLSALVLLFALFSGCCANSVCNCDDAKADIIKLTFSNQFTTADLDTLYLYRYPLVITTRTTPETITLIRLNAQPADTVFLNNTTPFAQVGTARLNQYKYLVRYRKTPRLLRTSTALIIDQVTLKGSLDGNGCCTCYTNYDKRIAARQDSSHLAEADTVYNLRPNPVFKIYKK